MATLFIEGFDKYGGSGQTIPDPGALITQGEWTGVGSGDVSITNSLTRFGGYALAAGGGGVSWISKTLANNYSRIIGGIRISPQAVSTSVSRLAQFTDISTPQCSILINVNGTFSLVNGSYTGTVLGTSTTSVAQSSTHYLEWDISFGASASYTLYLDGVSILSGTGNTKSSSNSYMNVFLVGNNAGSSAGTTYFDDLYLFDTTTSHNNAVLNSNPIIYTQYPSSDSQTQFTNVGDIIGTNYALTNSTSSTASNTLYLRKYVAQVASILNSISWIPATSNGSIHFKPVVYADSSGAPGTLLSGGAQVTASTSDAVIVAPLTTPQTLTPSASYWIGWITDTSILYVQQDNTSSLGYGAACTYTGGAPSTAPTMTPTLESYVLWGNCTGAITNWESVALDPAPGDYSSISSSAVGNEDLYGFPALATSITNVYSVAVKGHIRKSDMGTRTISLRVKSGSSDSGGTLIGQGPATTYGWMESYFDTDPNTSTTWTVTGLNAATSGLKIDS